MWRRLATDHVLMLAPRRVGSTSLLFKLRDDAPGHGFYAAYLSVADATSELDFVKKLCDALAKVPEAQPAFKRLEAGPLKRLLRHTRRIEAGPVSLEFDDTADGAGKDWTLLAEELAEALERLGNRWLLLVDELPVFISNMLSASVGTNKGVERARDFLHWFRKLRNPSHIETQLRWVLAGSIGLDALVARLNLGETLYDLRPVPLGAYARPVARSFLQELAESYRLDLSSETAECILDRAGWLIPYHLQVVFSQLLDRSLDSGEPPSPAMVDAACGDLMAPAFRHYFDYWRQRLRRELPSPLDAQALEVLAVAAFLPDGAAEPTLREAYEGVPTEVQPSRDELRVLLDMLVTDGYLECCDDRPRLYRFRSSLLREFWLRRVA